MKKIIVARKWVQYNSICLQTKLLVDKLSELFGIKVDWIDGSEIYNYLEREDVLIIWPLGSFSPLLIGKRRRLQNVVFVFHNITPPQYFIFNEPTVAIRSLMGYWQLCRLAKSNAKWVAVSDYNAEVLHKCGIKEVKVCPNILEKRTLNNRKSAKASVLYVGRIVQNKNCINLIKEVSKAANNLQERLDFTIVGRGKSASIYVKLFNKLVGKLNGNSNIYISIIDSVTDEQLKDLYQRSWVYVSMSKHEGFGLPVCEAICNGTPSLYLSCKGQDSVMKEIGSVPIDKFSTELNALLKDNAQREALLKQQSSIIDKYFSPQIDNTIYSIWRELIGVENEK